MRADAARNRALVVEAAEATFAERGADTSLEEVARRAGVGIGTLYRHFPTRDALVLTLMADGLAALIDLGPRLAAELPPVHALARWLEAYADHAASFRGLAATLIRPDLPADHPSVVACHAAEDAGIALVHAAVADGSVAPEVEPRDVLDIVVAAAWVDEHGADAHRRARLLDIVIGGVAPSARPRANR